MMQNKKNTQNISFEFHDSSIKEIIQDNKDIIIKFSEAYIHKSKGIPGVDKGSGWIQMAEFVLKEAVLRGTLPFFPCDIDRGILKVNHNVFTGLIPLPLDFHGEIELQIIFLHGDKITIKGNDAKFILIGNPTYIEEYPGK